VMERGRELTVKAACALATPSLGFNAIDGLFQVYDFIFAT